MRGHNVHLYRELTKIIGSYQQKHVLYGAPIVSFQFSFFIALPISYIIVDGCNYCLLLEKSRLGASGLKQKLGVDNF